MLLIVPKLLTDEHDIVHIDSADVVDCRDSVTVM